jgi:hypothetical protein
MANKYGVKEVADITFYDLTTNKPILFLDTLKMTTIENTAESAYARGGKGNPKLLSWDYNREGTVQMQDALMSTKSIALMTGNEVKTGVANVHKREVLTAVVGATGKSKVTPAKTPLAGSFTVFKINDDTTPVNGTLATGDITFNDTDVAVGTQVAVYYQFATDATAQTITISADKFPGYVKVVGDTVIRNADTGLDEAFQIIIDKAKIQPGFTFTFQADGDPTVFDMNLEIYRRTSDTEMYRMIKY